MVVDPRAQVEAELERTLAPLRARLAECDDRPERRELRRRIRRARAEARRLLRTTVW